MPAAIPNYEDFAVRFEREPGSDRLLVRLLHSPYGGCPPQEFRPPDFGHRPLALLHALEASILEADGSAGLPRHLAAQASNADLAVSPEVVGRELFESLFTGSVGEKLLRCLALTEGRGTSGLRLRLVLDPALVEILGIWPWELIYRFETRDFLGRGIRTPIVRQIEVQRPSLTPKPIDRLRVLAVVSNPTDANPLEVGREREKLEAALDAEPGIDLEYLEPPTVEALWRRLRDEPFDVLHFVGHGDIGSGGKGHLHLEDEGGLVEPISGTLLADTLKGFHPLRLVVLNACQTGRVPAAGVRGSDPFVGVATALVMAGVPAVVAMQFPISDPAAIAFSEAFYHAVAAGNPIDSAVVDGRMAISHALPASWEWVTPVLFLGVSSGSLFTRTDAGEATQGKEPARTPARADGETQVGKALDLLERLRYERALKAFRQAFEADPEDAKAAYYLALARLQGARPRSLRLDVVKRIESDLELAFDLVDGEPPAHVYFLQALIKHDFYRFKGLAIRPPTVEELLVEARTAEADPVELRRLRDHVPTPPSPVRDAIEACLGDSVD